MTRGSLRKGFSLVELSIVLVILGLLTGGILAGQSLIRASELRSVTADFQRYQSAFYTFRDQYQALPGDMRNAVRFWGAQAGAATDGMDTSCRDLTTAATGTATCNGNGDGTIAGYTPDTYETYRTWQHLANAGLIEGSYSGITASATANTFYVSLGINTPRSKISNTGYSVRYYPAYDASDTNYFAGHYGNLIMFGTMNSGFTYTSSAALKAEEAWNLDTKLDDGRPAFGRMRVQKNAPTDCITSTTAASSQYNVVTSATACPMFFLLGI